MKIDTYPVGWLAALIRLRQAYASTVPAAERDRIRAHGRAGIRSQLRANARQIRLRQWRSLKNTFNGYLCEPTPFPAGVRRCGSGWTKRRAHRSLDRQLTVVNTGSLATDQDKPGFAPNSSCTCPLGPEDAHFPDCPWFVPAVDRG